VSVNAKHTNVVEIPPTTELFTRRQLVARHPTLLTEPRVAWALRKRRENGLAAAVFESKGGDLFVHEPTFLRWFLQLDGLNKPRASRRRSVAA
jgi:hypothetical protein